MAAVLGALVGEDYYLKSTYPDLYETSKFFGSPKAFGLVILINIVASGLVTMMIGFGVGGARSKFVAKALKEGDKDAEKRFSLPKMQAEGFSQTAHEFNCLQRGHQQILESYGMYLMTALLGGLEFPVAVATFGAIWIKARYDWAEGYKSGPKERYSKLFASWSWFGILLNLIASSTLAVRMLMA